MATNCMKCWICKEWSNTDGHNAQPLCRGDREKLVCAWCNKHVVMTTRISLLRRGFNPRHQVALPPDKVRRIRELVQVERFEEWVWPKNSDEEVVEKSAPTRETKQTKAQSKRATPVCGRV